jgi:hypothetical protein
VKQIDAGHRVEARRRERQPLRRRLHDRRARLRQSLRRIGRRQVEPEHRRAREGRLQVAQEGARAAGQVEHLQSPLVAIAPGLGQQRERAPAHRARRPAEQRLHLRLVAARAVAGEPAAALEVEVLTVIGRIGFAAGLGPRLRCAPALAARLHLARIAHQVVSRPPGLERIVEQRLGRRIEAGAHVGHVLAERLDPLGPHMPARRRRRIRLEADDRRALWRAGAPAADRLGPVPPQRLQGRTRPEQARICDKGVASAPGHDLVSEHARRALTTREARNLRHFAGPGDSAPSRLSGGRRRPARCAATTGTGPRA